MEAPSAVACSRFFDRLALMVPARHFVDSGSAEEPANPFWHSKSRRSKEKQQAALAAGKLHKRLKLDPDEAKTTVEVQREVFAKRKGGGGSAAEQAAEPDVQYQKLEFNAVQGARDGEGSAGVPKRKQTKQALLKKALRLKEKEAGGQEDDDVAWESAFKRAEGGKVLDDPKRLAKAIKRERKSKEKKAARWKEIEENNRTKREEKQKKRTDNLKERTKQKLERRIAKKQKRK